MPSATSSTSSRPTTLPPCAPLHLCICWHASSEAWASRWCFRARVPTRCLAGYLYFHKAPDAKAFHEETVRKLGKLYLYDCLRANKSLAAWGIEGRVPFLDKEFLDVAMGMNPVLKMCPDKTIEKKVVREAFADSACLKRWHGDRKSSSPMVWAIRGLTP